VSTLTNPELPILVIDDEVPFLKSVTVLLRLAGVTNVQTCSDSRQIASMIGRNRYSLVLLDLLMPYVTGWDVIPLIAQTSPEVPIVVLTAADDIDSAVRCIKAGAFNYLLKPVDKERLLATISEALERWEVLRERYRISAGDTNHGLRRPQLFARIVTGDVRMYSLFQYVEAVAPTRYPVLITGETGTGKELMAQAIHDASDCTGELIAVNVAGLDDTLFSDTLFGHRRGAFTGADAERKGMIARAESGTLFLDEIGDLSVESQIRLLRLVQEGMYFQLGSDEPHFSNARIVFATNHDLGKKTEAGLFRKDFYYRLQSHHIHIPPLRERPKDIPLLIDHFLTNAVIAAGRTVKPWVPEELYELLRVYDFPGNIRELQGLIDDAMVRHDGDTLSLDRFRTLVFRRLKDSDSSDGNRPPSTVNTAAALGRNSGAELPGIENGEELPTIRMAEERLIDLAMRKTGGNQTRAAAILGITRQGLHAWLRKRSLREEDRPEGQ